MRTYAFRLLNVFAEQTLAGNPLCVFENAEGMSDAEMQALALQFNLSETTFLLPSGQVDARMRIFTPDAEMAFAGHPSIGTAHVLASLLSKRQQDAVEQVTLECKGGIVPVKFAQDRWTLTTPHRGIPDLRACTATRAEVAAMLGLDEADLLTAPVWVNTGSEQLLVPVSTAEAVARARPDAARLALWPANSAGRQSAYVFAPGAQVAVAGTAEVPARYFFVKPGGGFGEDPGTGSACANLGGWWIAQGRNLPVSIVVAQGAQARRPCRLYLDVGEDHAIRVGGRVVELGRGQLEI